MLALLSGRDHQVMTGCTLLRGDHAETFTEVTDLHFRKLSRKEIDSYVASGEPMEVFPPQLTRTPEGDLIEPLAVDIRADTIAASRKKLRKELPRLIAAMLRCPYDALVMREQKRKTRRVNG